MASFMKQPSILQGEEFYTKQMQDLQIWTFLIGLPKNKWVGRYFCYYKDISRAEGLKLITNKWDEIYL